MEDFIKKIKSMNMPPLEKDDVVKHMMTYLNTCLNVKKAMDITPYSLGQIEQMIQTIEVLYTIAIRSNIPIKEDGHDLIHRQTELAELKALIKKYEIDMYEALNS